MIRRLHRNTLFFCIVAIFALFCSTEAYCCNKVILKQSANVQNQMKKENVTYIVKYNFDLKGSEISIPKDSQLQFQGGSFSNGIVKGNATEVIAGHYRIFTKMTLAGSWVNKMVYSEWLDFEEGEKVDNARNFQNLMLLCAGDKMTHLYMQQGVFYCSVVTGSSNIKVPSNVYWHNSASIRQLSTDSPKFGFVLLQKCDNVTIDGGEFVGDVQSHIGSDGEWGHGIKVAGASNVVLKNFVSREFWGDGIDLIEGEYNGTLRAGVGPCNKVTIDNIKCLYNRRQGLSIEAAWNVVVKNSEFAFTGKYKITSPGAGVDIEPWCTNETKIENIEFFNCFVHNNSSQRDFCLEPTIQYHVQTGKGKIAPVSKVELKDCRLGKLYINGAHTASIVNCEIDEISRYNYGKNVLIEGCTIKLKSDIKSRTGLTMKRCK